MIKLTFKENSTGKFVLKIIQNNVLFYQKEYAEIIMRFCNRGGICNNAFFQIVFEGFFNRLWRRKLIEE